MSGPYRTQTSISLPVSTYSMENSLRNAEADQTRWRSDLHATLTNHAQVLVELQNDITDMRIKTHEMGEVLEWIKHTHPQVVVQYYAIKDIEEAGK